MFQLFILGQHLRNRRPTVTCVAKSLSSRKTISNEHMGSGARMRNVPRLDNEGTHTWRKITVAVCLETAGTVRNLRRARVVVISGELIEDEEKSRLERWDKGEEM